MQGPKGEREKSRGIDSLIKPKYNVLEWNSNKLKERHLITFFWQGHNKTCKKKEKKRKNVNRSKETYINTLFLGYSKRKGECQSPS